MGLETKKPFVEWDALRGMLDEAKDKLGLTIEDIAYEAGVHPTILYNFRSAARTQNLSGNNLMRIIIWLDIENFGQFLSEDELKKIQSRIDLNRNYKKHLIRRRQARATNR